MVVGPEYNAIMGVALGISRRVRSGVRDGLLALAQAAAPDGGHLPRVMTRERGAPTMAW